MSYKILINNKHDCELSINAFGLYMKMLLMGYANKTLSYEHIKSICFKNKIDTLDLLDRSLNELVEFGYIQLKEPLDDAVKEKRIYFKDWQERLCVVDDKDFNLNKIPSYIPWFYQHTFKDGKRKLIYIDDGGHYFRHHHEIDDEFWQRGLKDIRRKY